VIRESWFAPSVGAWEFAPTREDDPLHIDLADSDVDGITLQLPFAAIGARSLQLRINGDVSPVFLVARRAVKRVLDVTTALILLVVFLPIILLTAVAIRTSSRGPVFYRHRRIGRHGREFMVWKFRSMRSGLTVHDIAEAIAADEHKVESPVYKSPNDPRLTRVGRFIRRTGLDELPQLFNVLRGTMSLVGPRPLVDEEVAELSPQEFKHRHSVPPGLTGLWQVFRRSETTFDERMRLDLLYVGCQTLWLDLYLIMMTPLAVMKGERSF
jgi:lipopolysaccharide/colanic/teichoic acid biosynthesis glycosyltransferase